MCREKEHFHGWYIVAVCFVISLLFGGFIMQVPWMIHFFQALFDGVETTRSDFGLAVSRTMPLLFCLPLLVGWLVDRFGCKKLILAGCVVSGAGMMLFAGVSELWHYSLSSFLVMGGAAAATSIPIDALLVRWFRKHRGLAIAIASMGSGLGFLTVKLPISVPWEAIAGRKPALLIGVVALVITIPLILRVIKDRPSEMGLDPDGIAPAEEEPTEPAGHTLREALRTSPFWYIAGALMLVNMLSAVPMWSLIIHLRDTGSPIGSLIVTGEMLRGLPILFFPLIGLLADRRGATQTFVLLAPEQTPCSPHLF